MFLGLLVWTMFAFIVGGIAYHLCGALGFRVGFTPPGTTTSLATWLVFDWDFIDGFGFRCVGIRFFGVEIERRSR